MHTDHAPSEDRSLDATRAVREDLLN